MSSRRASFRWQAGSGTVLLGAYNNMIMTDHTHLGGWIGPDIPSPQVTVPYTSHVCPAPCEVALENAETVAADPVGYRSHPGDIPLLMFYHVQNFLTPYTHEADMPMDRFPAQRSSKIVRAMSDTFPIAVFLLAALGLVVTLQTILERTAVCLSGHFGHLGRDPGLLWQLSLSLAN